MTARNAFVEKWNELTKLLSDQLYAPVPDKVWEKPAKDLDKLIRVLRPYYTEPKVPSAAEIKRVKEHGITAQIKAFINRDKDRKAFFTVAYFNGKCASFPDKTLVQAIAKGTTRDSYLTAFLVYHYWKARPEPQDGLENAAREIESDYNNSPAAKQIERAKALLGDLRRESDFNRVVAILRDEFPDKEAVSSFAKAVGLKIPAGKKPIHERVAGKILKSGELVRAKF